MPVESLQCPKCGSPQLVESTSKFCTCTYCSVELRLTRGSSGHLLGIPPEASDAGITVRHLEQRLQGLLAQREELDGERQKDVGAALSQYTTLRQIRNGIVIFSTIMTVFGIATEVVWFSAGALIVVAILLAWGYVEKRRRRLEEQVQRVAAVKYERGFADIECEIQHVREQIGCLKADPPGSVGSP